MRIQLKRNGKVRHAPLPRTMIHSLKEYGLNPCSRTRYFIWTIPDGKSMKPFLFEQTIEDPCPIQASLKPIEDKIILDWYDSKFE